MSIKKVLSVMLILAFSAILFASCDARLENVREETDATIPINPMPEAGSKEKTTTRIYFGYLSERLLVGENRVVDVTDFESVEKSIIEEMAKGPSAERVDFTPLINPATKVVNVESQGQFLFITLSQEFVQPFGEEIDSSNEEQIAAEKRRKYLAVYSIVNTLIEQGSYSRVSILIDEEGSGRPLTQSEAGIDETNEATEPFEHKGDIILTGQNTMREILNAIEKKEWSTLYGYIAYKTSYGLDRPIKDDFINEMGAAKLSISNHEVLDEVVSQDGSSTVVMVKYELKLQDYEVRDMSNIPVRLIQENGVWKITYNVFRNKFMTQ